MMWIAAFALGALCCILALALLYVASIRLRLPQGRSTDAVHTFEFATAQAHAHAPVPLREADQWCTILDAAPLPIWQQNNNAVVWGNKTYLQHAKQIAQHFDTIPRVFDVPLPQYHPNANTQTNATNTDTIEKTTKPIRVQSPITQDWFTLVQHCINNTDAKNTKNHNEPITTVYALPANDTVLAEHKYKDFINNLSRGWSDLPIGLAVFDSARKLISFNPKLTELTNLDPVWLSKRPDLFMVLHQMREKGTLPEPKDYAHWRHDMVTLERTATQGNYKEIWTLANGDTYDVTGHPYANGGLILLFRDISEDMVLLRCLRAEKEIGQAVLDAIGTAMAVFKSDGILVLINKAYIDLWQSDPLATLAPEQINFADVARTWEKQCTPAPIWQNIYDFMPVVGAWQKWSETIHTKNNTALTITFTPLRGGAIWVEFTPLSAVSATTANTLIAHAG